MSSNPVSSEQPSIAPAELTGPVLVKSLRGMICPMCGKSKKPAMTLCFRDYKRLPRDLQAALYQRLGEGYREAVIDAFTCLEVERFVLPG